MENLILQAGPNRDFISAITFFICVAVIVFAVILYRKFFSLCNDVKCMKEEISAMSHAVQMNRLDAKDKERKEKNEE